MNTFTYTLTTDEKDFFEIIQTKDSSSENVKIIDIKFSFLYNLKVLINKFNKKSII